MTLEELGYTTDLNAFRKSQGLDSFGVGRVISEHKDRYIVKTDEGEYDAEIIGNLRFSSLSRTDFPAVGDWVAISEYDENKVLIHSVFPRKTILERQAIGKQGEKQIIATNIDHAFILQAVDRDFNINRIERYLTICNESNVKPVIILTKTDLINELDLNMLTSRIQERVKEIPIVPVSNKTGKGIEELKETMVNGKTYCLLGSSGVGKSTLINSISGQYMMKTDTISTKTNKGRHITSHRELFVLKNRGIIIDNPGMKEVGIANSTGGLAQTFDSIIQLSKDCKYKDCTHTTENHCAVLAAVEKGEINMDSYENYMKMERENEHFRLTLAERRRKDKDFGKMLKQHKKKLK